METFKQILAVVFGHKYWVNIVWLRGTDRCEMTSHIWPSRAAAKEHRRQIEETLSYGWMETISFRSRTIYKEIPLQQ